MTERTTPPLSASLFDAGPPPPCPARFNLARHALDQGAAAEKVGGRGGGRPDMAQAGGNDPDGVASALDLVATWVAETLAAGGTQNT